MDTTEGEPRSPKVRPRELIQWAHPGVMGDVLRTLCLGAQSALHCTPPPTASGSREPYCTSSQALWEGWGLTLPWGGAGGLSHLSGDRE